MLYFIMCDYHGCERQHTAELEHNHIVNLLLVETFIKEGRTSIKFVFPKNEPIIWRFINDAIRDLEFDRVTTIAMEHQLAS